MAPQQRCATAGAGAASAPVTIKDRLYSLVKGQNGVLDDIVPYVTLFNAGLSPAGRPAGVFFLLGPSGTGKTKTVEALAEVLHENPKNLLRIDCGEFQMDHEVAKLIGAPPGYLGHRETTPLLTQLKLNAIASDKSSASILLFDEIEKAAPSLSRILLAVLDKGRLNLGDNTTVSFDKTFIFFTSNVGSAAILQSVTRSFGFTEAAEYDHEKVRRVALAALARQFSPEFLNRVDATLIYRALDAASFEEILMITLDDVQDHLVKRMGLKAPVLEIDDSAKQFLLKRGISAQYGARELKRTIHKYLLTPIADLIVNERLARQLAPKLKITAGEDSLVFG